VTSLFTQSNMVTKFTTNTKVATNGSQFILK
jgi:hypothetical protein